MKKIVLAIISALVFVFAARGIVEALPFGGVEFPSGEISFADNVFNYSPTSGVASPYNGSSI